MRRFVKDILLPMAVAIALAFVIQAAVAKPYEIPTESMVPTIKANDRIIANRLIYRFRDIERGDIIVFEPPPSATRTCGDAGGGNIPFVKRVIGLPGRPGGGRAGTDRRVVNGKPFDRRRRRPQPAAADRAIAAGLRRCPPDQLLVLGDNRPELLRLPPVEARPVRARGQRHRPGRGHLLAAVATSGS